jgi:hypothetical protein
MITLTRRGDPGRSARHDVGTAQFEQCVAARCLGIGEQEAVALAPDLH